MFAFERMSAVVEVFEKLAFSLSEAAGGLFLSVLCAFCIAWPLSTRRLGRLLLGALATVVSLVPFTTYVLLDTVLLPPGVPLGLLLSFLAALAIQTPIVVNGVNESLQSMPLVGSATCPPLLRRICHIDCYFVGGSLLLSIRLSIPSAILASVLGGALSADSRGIGPTLIEWLKVEPNLALGVSIALGVMACSAYAGLAWLSSVLRSRIRLSEFDRHIETGKLNNSAEEVLVSLGLATGLAFVAWLAMSSTYVAAQALLSNPKQVFVWATTGNGLRLYWEAFSVTASRCVTAAIACLLFSYLLVSIGYIRSGFAIVLRSVAILLQAIPAWAYAAPLILLFGRSGFVAIVIALLAAFLSAYDVLSGRRATFPKSVEMALTIAPTRAHRRQAYVFLPWLLPWMFTTIRVILPQIVSAVLVCEYLIIGDGLGWALRTVRTHDYDAFWAITAGIVMLGLVSIGLLSISERALSHFLQLDSGASTRRNG